jgi:NAD(P)-dependent dehydrogenase (short-subunit alcohol dehydrogenase family)
VARTGIRVNAVCPGTVRTPMLRGFVGDEATLEAMGRRAPMGRLGEPAEIAEAIVWLLSDAASFVTGAVIDPDGGVSAIG